MIEKRILDKTAHSSVIIFYQIFECYNILIIYRISLFIAVDISRKKNTHEYLLKLNYIPKHACSLVMRCNDLQSAWHRAIFVLVFTGILGYSTNIGLIKCILYRVSFVLGIGTLQISSWFKCIISNNTLINYLFIFFFFIVVCHDRGNLNWPEHIMLYIQCAV